MDITVHFFKEHLSSFIKLMTVSVYLQGKSSLVNNMYIYIYIYIYILTKAARQHNALTSVSVSSMYTRLGVPTTAALLRI